MTFYQQKANAEATAPIRPCFNHSCKHLLCRNVPWNAQSPPFGLSHQVHISACHRCYKSFRQHQSPLQRSNSLLAAKLDSITSSLHETDVFVCRWTITSESRAEPDDWERLHASIISIPLALHFHAMRIRQSQS